MTPFGSALFAIVALQASAPAEEGYYMCELERVGAGGTVTVTQSIPTQDEPSERETSWIPLPRPSGISFAAVWEGDRPAENIAAGRVQSFFLIFLRRARFRFVIRRIGRDGAVTNGMIEQLKPAGQAPATNIAWPVFRMLAQDAEALELVAMRHDGKIASTVRIDAKDIEQVEAAVADAQPAFDAIVADRRNQCDFTSYSSMLVTAAR